MDYNLCPRPIFQVHLKRFIPTGFDLSLPLVAPESFT